MDKSRDKDNQLQKDEYSLYLINTKALSPILFIRKLYRDDLVLRIYQKSIEAFKKDGPERFKLCFVK